MRALRPAIAGLITLVLVLGASAPGAGADPVTDAGIAWLETQQESDGGFEVADFAGFETPDAVLAIATNAQTSATWSTSEAVEAVEAVQSGGNSGLDWIDDWVDGGTVPPEQRAKLIVLVAAPFGFDPEDFDPEDDDAPGSSADLTAGLDGISPGLFNGFMVGRLAEAELGQNVHQADLQVICEAQKASGGWSFDGDPAGTNAADLDTTGFAVMALRAAGLDPSAEAVTAAADFVEDGQQANGSWQSFGADDPNATTLALWAWVAAGNAVATLPHDAVAWLQGEQVDPPATDAGRFESPNDGFGINTFATSQAVQALHLALPTADWLPRRGASGRRCLPAATYADVVADAFYEDGARWADDEGIVAGIQGELRPTRNVNRAQASMWLNLMYGGIGGDPHPFSDVRDGSWYEDGADFVSSAPNGPIARGSRLRPKDDLTRAEAAAWLYALAGTPDVSGLPPHGYSDVGTTGRVGNAVRWAKANDIVVATDQFRPNGNVKRGQLAQWMFMLAATPEAWPDTATVPPTVIYSG